MADVQKINTIVKTTPPNNTGCAASLHDLLMQEALPFLSMWRDPAITQFTADTIQPLLDTVANDKTAFYGFDLAADRLSVVVQHSGFYQTHFRTQATKNDLGQDTGTTATQLLVNGVAEVGMGINWFQWVDATAPGDDDNQGSDKSKTGILPLTAGDILQFNITNTFGNDIFGVQAFLNYLAPLTVDVTS